MLQHIVRISNINTKDRIGRFCINYSFCFEVLGQLRDDSRTSGKHEWNVKVGVAREAYFTDKRISTI